MPKNWTKEECEYLENHWGESPMPAIAQKLGRSINAVRVKAQRLKLGAFLQGGGYITLNELRKAISSSDSYGYQMISWVKNRGLPVHTKKVINHRFRIVYLKDFWEWAEKNRSFIDFSKIEPLIFGEEPGWVKEQRKKDFVSNSLQKKDPWTKLEDERLKMLLKQQRYTWAELSEIVHRTEGAIQRRCATLGIKDRPIRADSHGESAKWTGRMYEIVKDGIKNGDCYALIAKRIGKSEKAVRGKVYAIYRTENTDKVRAMLDSGK